MTSMSFIRWYKVLHGGQSGEVHGSHSQSIHKSNHVYMQVSATPHIVISVIVMFSPGMDNPSFFFFTINVVRGLLILLFFSWEPLWYMTFLVLIVWFLFYQIPFFCFFLGGGNNLFYFFNYVNGGCCAHKSSCP